MNPIIGLFFDILILAALGSTLFYCFRLSRQFNQMQSDKKAFEILIHNMNIASARAEAAIKSIKESAIGGSEALQGRINKSRSLIDELEIMLEAGDSLATRLEVLAKKSRIATMSNSIEELESEEKNGRLEIKPRTKAEQELLEAVKANKK